MTYKIKSLPSPRAYKEEKGGFLGNSIDSESWVIHIKI